MAFRTSVTTRSGSSLVGLFLNCRFRDAPPQQRLNTLVATDWAKNKKSHVIHIFGIALAKKCKHNGLTAIIQLPSYVSTSPATNHMQSKHNQQKHLQSCLLARSPQWIPYRAATELRQTECRDKFFLLRNLMPPIIQLLISHIITFGSPINRKIRNTSNWVTATAPVNADNSNVLCTVGQICTFTTSAAPPVNWMNSN